MLQSNISYFKKEFNWDVIISVPSIRIIIIQIFKIEPLVLVRQKIQVVLRNDMNNFSHQGFSGQIISCIGIRYALSLLLVAEF